MNKISSLVTTEWLSSRLSDAHVRILDASWHMPTPADPHSTRGKTDYTAGHIPGSVFFNLDQISDQMSTLPHMMPSAADFALEMGRI